MRAAPVSPAPNYPVNLVLADRPVLVVGGGNVAVRKVAGLVAAGGNVTVVAPEVLDAVRTQERVRVFERSYERGEVASYRLAITCTNDSDVNAQVFRDGEAAGVWVNSADDPINCAFTLPSVTRQGDLSIAVSTAGRSPALATWLRRRFTTEFDEGYLDLIDVLADVRAEAREQLGSSEVAGWQEALDDGVFDLVSDGRLDEARASLREAVGLTESNR